ncbi:MAG: LacI family DNA-binding transcriptional regulator [Planctomycetaceae bacterium]
MAGHRVSIKDVAQEAGVSVTTVSHALNDKGRLNPETRRRVREVAERLGYRPNPAARSLVSGRTGLIAAMASLPPEGVEFSEFGYYTELIGAASGEAVDRDYAMVVAPPSHKGFVWDRVSLDGVIVIDPIEGDPALPALRSRGIPFVTIGRDPDDGEGDAVVTSDEEQGTCLVLDHLLENGAERVAVLSVPPLNAFVQDTLACYRRWCGRRGREEILEVFDIEPLVRDRDAAMRAALDTLLAEDIDALYVVVEMAGVAALAHLQERGIRIPQDLLLATTHDAGRAANAEPALTTLSFDYAEQGRLAAQMLLDLIDGTREPPQLELVPTWLDARASTRR